MAGSNPFIKRLTSSIFNIKSEDALINAINRALMRSLIKHHRI